MDILRKISIWNNQKDSHLVIVIIMFANYIGPFIDLSKHLGVGMLDLMM